MFLMLQRRWCESHQKMNCGVIAVLSAVLLLGTAASAQKPIAELPRVHIDTTWNEPKGGTIWRAHTAAELSAALAGSAPGDEIVLDAGATYVGTFNLPANANPANKWIYVISSNLALLPEGKRVTPSDAANMPRILPTNSGSAIYLKSGANHWRFSGIEISSASTYRPSSYPANRFYGQALVQNSDGMPAVLPDSITFDRCYLHGDLTHDLQRALAANWSNAAIVDSWISDIHAAGLDTQAIGVWWSPGPFKIVNNHLEAATENVIFGGAGGANDPYVPSDIEIRNNHLYKPLAWAVVGAGVSPGNTMVIKNLFELKSAERVLFDSNTLENNWANGQVGFAIVLTIMTSQSGNIAVVNDITITNNILKNVVSGVNIVAKDYTCKPPVTPNCTNPGSQDRFYIANNLIQFYDPTLPGGVRNTGLQIAGGTDYITNPGVAIPGVPRNIMFQHNTMIPAASTPCWNSVIFATATNQVPNGHISNNIWILDNVLCRQVGGVQGLTPLAQYMSDPTTPPYDLTHRFYGNVMYVPAGSNAQSFPPHNILTTKAVRYVDPTKGNFDLRQPKLTETSDGKLAGVDSAKLPQ
jgi:hypothetical protein